MMTIMGWLFVVTPPNVLYDTLLARVLLLIMVMMRCFCGLLRLLSTRYFPVTLLVHDSVADVREPLTMLRVSLVWSGQLERLLCRCKALKLLSCLATTPRMQVRRLALNMTVLCGELKVWRRVRANLMMLRPGLRRFLACEI